MSSVSKNSLKFESVWDISGCASSLPSQEMETCLTGPTSAVRVFICLILSTDLHMWQRLHPQLCRNDNGSKINSTKYCFRYYIWASCCIHIHIFTLNITVFNTTLSTLVFTLVLHVSATLGHHQVLLLLLLQLFHCNFAFISFYCTLIQLLHALSHFLLSVQVHFFVLNNFKI
jgi:hypothetical protein